MIDTAIARHWFMHTPHAAIGMGGNTKVRAAQTPAPPRKTRTLRVGIVAGRDAMWDSVAERLAASLGSASDMMAERAWQDAIATDEVADDFDCLVLLGWPSAAHRDQLKRIEHYCRGGGNLVALRTLDADMPGWPDFAEEAFGGRQPAARRSRLLEVQRSDTAWHHPIVDGVDELIAEGDVYRGPRLSPLATVLLTADDGRSPAPVAWTTRHEGGRVFCTTLGHEDDFREPAFLRLIANAVRWVGMVRR